MTTTERPSADSLDALTVFLPVSPMLGLEHCLRDIRSEFKSLLADLDAELDALYSRATAEAPEAQQTPAQPRKKRWHR